MLGLRWRNPIKKLNYIAVIWIMEVYHLVHTCIDLYLKFKPIKMLNYHLFENINIETNKK